MDNGDYKRVPPAPSRKERYLFFMIFRRIIPKKILVGTG